MLHDFRTVSVPTAGVLLALAAGSAGASCGAAYCVLNSDWDAYGVQASPGRTSADFRFEFLPQKATYTGSSRRGPAPGEEEATEQRTFNRNYLLSLEHGLTSNLTLGLALPVVSRFHSHIADPEGAATPESWNFTRAGDLRLQGRYQLSSGDHDAAGIQFGVKLPTGSYRVANSQGAAAERSLQPGTGSTDLIVGAYYAYRPRFEGLNWFVQALYQSPVASRDHYRPGDQVSLSAGLSHPWGEKLSVLFQVNALYKARDRGANAEPDVSGGTYVFASPGLSYSLGAASRVYAYVQAPLYRQVNGSQLTADWSVILGASRTF